MSESKIFVIFVIFVMMRWGRREREKKVSWAEAAPQLLTNSPNWSLSLFPYTTWFVCNHQYHQFVTWSLCASLSNGCAYSRCTTSLQCHDEHNFRSSYLGLGLWAEVRNWLPFIFWILLGGEHHPIVVEHLVCKGGLSVVEPSYCQHVTTCFWTNLNWKISSKS